MLGSAAALVAELKSLSPATWHAVQLSSGPGNSTSAKLSSAAPACHMKSTVRLRAPWMAWMKSLALPDQPLVDWFGLWQNEQVGPLLRCPAWNVGAAPSSTW